jgi:hypothetical protein
MSACEAEGDGSIPFEHPLKESSAESRVSSAREDNEYELLSGCRHSTLNSLEKIVVAILTRPTLMLNESGSRWVSLPLPAR